MRAAFSFLLLFLLAPTKPAAEQWWPTRDGEQIGSYCRAYDGRTKSNRWTLEILTADDLANRVKRHNGFHEDLSVPKEFRPSPKDYDKSGYDQGHLAPAGNYLLSETEQRATFAITNVVPQTSESNRYTMRLLEEHVRDMAEMGCVIVVTAPAYVPAGNELRVATIGENGVWVPTHVGKAVLLLSEPPVAKAWLVPNDRVERRKYEKTEVSVDAFEKATGLDVFQALPDDIEESLEASLALPANIR